MLRRFYVMLVPALTLVVAVSVLLPGDTCADDFSKFVEKAKKKYEEYQAEVLDETIVQEMTTATATGEMTTHTTVYRMGDKMRVDSKMEMPRGAKKADAPQVIESTVVHNGTDYWMATPTVGKRKLGTRERQQYQTERHLWDMIPDKATMIGSEKLGERDCYIVALAGEEDSAGAKLWMDKKSLVIVVVETGGVRGQKSRTVNSDFRKAEGDWEIPYKTQIFRGERLLSTLVVTRGVPGSLLRTSEMETTR
jgi:outer membrane lipoprotein-sorting protein